MTEEFDSVEQLIGIKGSVYECKIKDLIKAMNILNAENWSFKIEAEGKILGAILISRGDLTDELIKVVDKHLEQS
jgi:hypothetical protein